MKVLLAVLVSTVIANPTYAACSKDTPGDCKDQKSCEAISEAGGKTFKFDTASGKCLSQGLQSTVASDCLTDQSGKGSIKGAASGSSADGKEAKGTAR